MKKIATLQKNFKVFEKILQKIATRPKNHFFGLTFFGSNSLIFTKNPHLLSQSGREGRLATHKPAHFCLYKLPIGLIKQTKRLISQIQQSTTATAKRTREAFLWI